MCISGFFFSFLLAWKERERERNVLVAFVLAAGDGQRLKMAASNREDEEELAGIVPTAGIFRTRTLHIFMGNGVVAVG